MKQATTVAHFKTAEIDAAARLRDRDTNLYRKIKKNKHLPARRENMILLLNMKYYAESVHVL